MTLFHSIIIMIFITSCSGNDMSVQTYKSKKLKISEIEGMSKQSSIAIKWYAPSSWKVLKANSIRIASYELPSANGNKGEVSIISLSGDGGGDLANINRWRGQLSLSELTSDELKRFLVDLKGKLGMYKYIAITNKKSKKSILAAFILSGQKTIYVKAIGDSSLINSNETAFKKFVQGIYEN